MAKDMPEFYDHVEEEIDAEMKQLNRLKQMPPVLCLYCGKDVSAFTKDGNIYVGSCTRCNPDPTREIRFINFSTGKTPTKIKFYYIGDEEE